VPYKDQGSFVTFANKGDVCFAPVGRDDGENEILLPTKLENPNCMAHGTILHEIMHSLGFDHLHTTPDRDYFIFINWDSIARKNRKNFKVDPHQKVTDFGLGYDFDSVMHYDSKAFSKYKNEYAMEAFTGDKDTKKMGNIGSLSQGDIRRIRAMYNCDGDRPEQDYTGLESEAELREKQARINQRAEQEKSLGKSLSSA
jgi:Astacin (Peptidase family M12A)